MKDFVPYQEALALKQLGFDEPCFGSWEIEKTDTPTYTHSITTSYKNSNHSIGKTAAPLYQQAFRWFREKHNLKSCIMFRTSMEDNKEYYDWLIKGQEVVYRHFNTYEEAELTCLKKLIEIVKQPKKD